MSLSAFGVYAVLYGFPRVSGDEPAADAPSATTPMFSPRERG